MPLPAPCNSANALIPGVSNRMLGTPSLTANAIFIGERVQNFRCRQLEGSGSSGKLRPKSITVTTGPPSGLNTSPCPPQKCHPIRPTVPTSATPPIRKYRARQGFLGRPPFCQDQKPPTEGIVIVLAERSPRRVRSSVIL